MDPSEGKEKALRNMFDGIIADGKRVAEEVRRRVDSVATKGSIASSESNSQTLNGSSTTSGTSHISASKDDRMDDVDDFTTEHPNEQEELLSTSWIEMDSAPDPSTNQNRTLRAISAETSSDQKDLIEFETN